MEIIPKFWASITLLGTSSNKSWPSLCLFRLACSLLHFVCPEFQCSAIPEETHFAGQITDYFVFEFDKRQLFPFTGVWVSKGLGFFLLEKRKANNDFSNHMELESQNWRLQRTSNIWPLFPTKHLLILHERLKDIF